MQTHQAISEQLIDHCNRLSFCVSAAYPPPPENHVIQYNKRLQMQCHGGRELNAYFNDSGKKTRKAKNMTPGIESML